LVLEQGKPRSDRTGTGTLSIFGAQARFDLRENFPLLTTKKLHLKSIIYELLWFLRGDTNIKYLNEHGVTIWDEWANEDGNLGRVYGAQWRDWRGENGVRIDQTEKVISEIKTNPHSRRLIRYSGDDEGRYAFARPFASCIAVQMRAGLAGMSMWRMP